jgi:hypothetical protein
MAQFVEEHHQAEHEQKGNQICDHATTERVNVRQKVCPHDAFHPTPFFRTPSL